MRTYKKFQNSNMHGPKGMLCIIKRDKRMNGRTPKKQYAPPTSSKYGGIKGAKCFYWGILENIMTGFLLEKKVAKKFMLNW